MIFTPPMECEFIVDDDEGSGRPVLSGWEAVVFELEDDPLYGLDESPHWRRIAAMREG